MKISFKKMLTAKNSRAMKRHINGCIHCVCLNPISKINIYRLSLLTTSCYSRSTIIFTIARERIQATFEKENINDNN